MTDTGGYQWPGCSEQDIRLYRWLAADASREVREEFEIARERGKAFEVRKGEILRVSCPHGPQVADMNIFNLHQPREMFWSGRTRLIERAHPTVGNRLWSTPPRMVPMFTIIADTVEHTSLPHNARCHDLMFCRCNGRMLEMLSGAVSPPNCQDNLAHAIEPFGLDPSYVHDAFNIFMTTGLNDKDRFFFLQSAAKQGDYVEMHAEMDCLVAISACPGGSRPALKLPLGVAIFRPRGTPPAA